MTGTMSPSPCRRIPWSPTVEVSTWDGSIGDHRQRHCAVHRPRGFNGVPVERHTRDLLRGATKPFLGPGQGRGEDRMPSGNDAGGPKCRWSASGGLSGPPRRSRPIASSRFHQKVLPVGGNPSSGSRHGLVEGMMLRGCEVRPFHVFVCSVVPKPILAWLEAADDRVP